MHTNRSQSRGKSRVSHAENEKDMQHEIDELKKKLRRARRRRASFESESSSGDTEDDTYRQISKTHLVKPSPVMKNTVIIGRRAKVPCIRA